MSGRIGAGSSASIIATTLEPCAGYSATIATSPLVTPSPKQPPAQWSNTSDFTTEQIASIEPAGVAEVFDLQIAQTENFIANGLVSHNTRWHHDDLAGRILAAQEAGGDQWEVLHLPAVAEKDDPLDREPGAALWPEKYDRASLERTKVAVGSRVWSALYQGTPSNDESALLKREWWRFYGGPTGIALPPFWDQALQSWDMTFKGGTQNDYVAGQVWARRGADCYLLARDKRRLDFPATLAAIRAMSAQYPDVHTKLVEDTANGPAVIATLEREIGGLVAVRPEGGKVARVNAVAGLVEAGNVWLPHPTIAPWVGDFIEECAAFPTGAHDDDVDAMSQALVRLGASNVIQIGTYLGAARR
jgi:predicted phage terminase large subunit-like protein